MIIFIPLILRLPTCSHLLCLSHFRDWLIWYWQLHHPSFVIYIGMLDGYTQLPTIHELRSLALTAKASVFPLRCLSYQPKILFRQNMQFICNCMKACLNNITILINEIRSQTSISTSILILLNCRIQLYFCIKIHPHK